jgi:CrcB protein
VTWLLVGVGGAVGSVARYGLNMLVTSAVPTFPLGIFIINVIGSAAIGLVAGVSMHERAPFSEDARTILTVGLLGGFTTFSAFSLDTLMLARAGRVTEAALNCGGQVLLSLIAVWVGFRVGSS